ncbi:hypothetical protein BAOM_2531 [Peribacillus asahii]|uniref:Uncharacterized protein n=1 Tax=Peribacillus asahii TaxID=228899 RepID=A0A3T0KS57_9BACI|nr:hypothetical protein BAOM_2531 [Peribacillus asahii]
MTDSLFDSSLESISPKGWLVLFKLILSPDFFNSIFERLIDEGGGGVKVIHSPTFFI